MFWETLESTDKTNKPPEVETPGWSAMICEFQLWQFPNLSYITQVYNLHNYYFCLSLPTIFSNINGGLCLSHELHIWLQAHTHELINLVHATATSRAWCTNSVRHPGKCSGKFCLRQTNIAPPIRVCVCILLEHVAHSYQIMNPFSFTSLVWVNILPADILVLTCFQQVWGWGVGVPEKELSMVAF